MRTKLKSERNCQLCVVIRNLCWVVVWCFVILTLYFDSHGAKYAQRRRSKQVHRWLQDSENTGQRAQSGTLVHVPPRIYHHHHHHHDHHCLFIWIPISCIPIYHVDLGKMKLASAAIDSRWMSFVHLIKERLLACSRMLLLLCMVLVSTPFCPGSLWKSWHSTMRRKCPFGKEAKEGYRDSWR